MKKIILVSIYYFLLLFPIIVFGQYFELEQAIFRNSLSVLQNKKMGIGLNTEINDFEKLDGTVIKAAFRLNPFFNKKDLLKKTEIGLNVEGYFNKENTV